MNSEIKKRWVEALRSGEYRQAKGAMRRVSGDGTHSFCCLGVLCDLAAKDGVGEWSKHPNGMPSNSGGPYIDFLVDKSTASGFPPPSVQVWAGLTAKSPIVRNVPLSHRNDCGASFKEIADLIEQYL